MPPWLSIASNSEAAVAVSLVAAVQSTPSVNTRGAVAAPGTDFVMVMLSPLQLFQSSIVIVTAPPPTAMRKSPPFLLLPVALAKAFAGAIRGLVGSVSMLQLSFSSEAQLCNQL